MQHMVALLDCHLPEGEQQEGLSRKKTQTKAKTKTKTKTKKIIWLLWGTATLPPTRGGATRGTFQLSRKKIQTKAKTKTNKKTMIQMKNKYKDKEKNTNKDKDLERPWNTEKFNSINISKKL